MSRLTFFDAVILQKIDSKDLLFVRIWKPYLRFYSLSVQRRCLAPYTYTVYLANLLTLAFDYFLYVLPWFQLATCTAISSFDNCMA